MDPVRVVDFVARGLDDLGRPSRAFVEVTEVAVVGPDGTVLGRFRDAEQLGSFLIQVVKGSARLVAVETVGLPRFDLSGKYVCYDQASSDLLAERNMN